MHYKELACRRCGHIWKWSLDKKCEPVCPKGYGCNVEETLYDKVLSEILQHDITDEVIASYVPNYIGDMIQMMNDKELWHNIVDIHMDTLYNTMRYVIYMNLCNDLEKKT